MAIAKPDLTRVWAAGAAGVDIVDPDVTTPGKFAAGWIAELPKYQHFNFLQKFFTEAAAYNNEQGINEWDSDTIYPVKGIVKGSDGKLYRAIVEQANNDPVSDGGVNWIDLIATDGFVGSLANNTYLQGEQLDETPRDLIGVDASNRIVIGNDFTPVIIKTGNTGVIQIIEDSDAQSAARFDFYDAVGGNLRGQIGYNNSGTALNIKNQIDAGAIEFDTSGATSETRIKQNGINRIQVTQSRTNFWDGLDAANTAFTTEDWNDAAETSAMRLRDGGGSLRNAGFNQFNPQTLASGTFNTFAKSSVNQYIIHTGSAALTLTVIDPGISSPGQSMVISNDGSAGAVATTINQGSQTLKWFNGSSVQTGNRSLAVGGIATIIRTDTGVFHIFGSGIS